MWQAYHHYYTVIMWHAYHHYYTVIMWQAYHHYYTVIMWQVYHHYYTVIMWQAYHHYCSAIMMWQKAMMDLNILQCISLLSTDRWLANIILNYYPRTHWNGPFRMTVFMSCVRMTGIYIALLSITNNRFCSVGKNNIIFVWLGPFHMKDG